MKVELVELDRPLVRDPGALLGDQRMLTVVQQDLRAQTQVVRDHVGGQVQRVRIAGNLIRQPAEVGRLFDPARILPELADPLERRLAQRRPDAVDEGLLMPIDRQLDTAPDEEALLALVIRPDAEVL